MIRNLLVVGILLAALCPSVSALLFEDYCGSSGAWDLLDLEGDAKVIPSTDPSCPPGYGPEALHIEARYALLMPKDLKFTEGTIVALYRENDPREDDADGIVLFRADYPMDLSLAHNTKEKRSHVWLEQDNDAGFHVRAFFDDGHETSIVERHGYGIITDSWNKTRWIWQKVLVEGNRVRAKYWPAQQPEPDEWALETTWDGPGDRFGIRISTGNIQLAYLAADAEDIRPQAPPAYLVSPLDRIADAGTIDLLLFSNSDEKIHKAVDVVVRSENRELARSSVKLEFPAGHGENAIRLVTGDLKPDGHTVSLREKPAPGPCQVEIADKDGNPLARTTLNILPTGEILERIGKIDSLLTDLSGAIGDAEEPSEKRASIQVLHDAARGHLTHARERLRDGKPEDADMSLRFVEGALSELNGYKGTWLHEIAPDIDLGPFPDPGDNRRGIGKPRHGKDEYYSKEYLIRFEPPTLEAQSFSMGHTYDVVIPWTVEGASPDRDFAFSVRLVSPLGNRVVAQSNAQPEVPTSQWKPDRTHNHHVSLNVLPEDLREGGKPIGQPVVLDELHRLLVTVTDPETGADLLLGNEPGPHPDRVGQSFLLEDIYVSSAPLEVRGFTPLGSQATQVREDVASIRNVGTEMLSFDALFAVRTETGRTIFQEAISLQLGPGVEQPVEFRWTPTFAGELTFELQLMRDGVSITEARRIVAIDPPEGFSPRIVKKNHVERDDGPFSTPITVHAGGNPTPEFKVQVLANKRLVGSATTREESVTVLAEPWFGYYDVAVDFGSFIYEERLVATVAEVDGMDLLVNGEPFLVKGVNVHGMDASSPARTATMMRIMRDLGFNLWRGDYPPRWQIDLAYELNTAYTVLAPFSCKNSSEIFGRQEGRPLITSRETSRLFVQRYRDSPGVLLWNSCNEIVGESVDFLTSLYPVYKAYDPYERPVHYANLFGQDLHQGQDLMGINNYFSDSQTAEDKQPIVTRSLEVARANDLPVMFCEFNSYCGAVHSTGVDAMRGFYEWGVSEGMSGGVQYFRFNSTSHPGVIDNGFNTHKIYDDAIIRAFADAEVSLVGTSDDSVSLRVRNKRRCTLRQAKVHPRVSGVDLESMTIADVGPEESVDVDLILPGTLPGPTITVEGTLEFVTHYGFRSKVPFNLIVQ